MSLRVGQRATDPNGKEGWITSAHAFYDEGFSCKVVLYKVNGRWWDEAALTPLPEPDCSWGDRLKWAWGIVSMHNVTFTITWEEEGAEDHSYASRLSLITYPELFICEKAGECKTRGRCDAIPRHDGPHEHYANCDVRCGSSRGTCIPYVPEDEARDWVVVFGHALTKRTKDQAEQLTRGNPEYRAFKWSDGLKGGE